MQIAGKHPVVVCISTLSVHLSRSLYAADTELVSDCERGNTGSESSEDTVEAVGESGEASLLSSPGPATGDSGGGTGTRRAPAWDSRWPRCALWRYSRLGRTHADCEE